MSKVIDSDRLLYFKTRLVTWVQNNFIAKDGSKTLTTNDFTDAYKTKLDGIDAEADKTTVINNLTSTSTTSALSAYQGKVLDEKIAAINTNMEDLGAGDMLKSVYDMNNDGIVDKAEDAETVEGHTVESNVPANAVFTDTTYSAVGTTGDPGLMTAADKVKLNGIATGAEVNKIETVKLNGTPLTITSKSVNVTVPTTVGELSDATNYALKTDLPTVNDATLTIQKNGTNVKSFTANASSNVTCNITVPTTVAELSDAGNYALKTDLANVYKYKGQVATYSALPSTGLTAGDIYDVEEDGHNYAWNGTEWDDLGGERFTITYAENTDIDAMFT